MLKQSSGIRLALGQIFLTNLVLIRIHKMIQQSEKDRDEKLEDLMVTAKAKQLTKEEQTQLLNEIRNGNKEGIVKLVDSWDVTVLSIAKQLSPTMIEEMLIIGRKELFKLAEMEVNSEIGERFFKLGAWCVKQAIIRIKSYGGK